MKDNQGPNCVPCERYQLSDQNRIPNSTQVLSLNSPSNEAKLPLNQRHLGKAKLEKRHTKTKERLQNQLQGRKNSMKEQNAT